ncbi:hypothetical protein B7990_07330 [Fibrobacter sp. UWB4]|nr:hypothetical protein B7990_07330 [Fibrobacter sp. UWB4]
MDFKINFHNTKVNIRIIREMLFCCQENNIFDFLGAAKSILYSLYNSGKGQQNTVPFKED